MTPKSPADTFRDREACNDPFVPALVFGTMAQYRKFIADNKHSVREISLIVVGQTIVKNRYFGIKPSAPTNSAEPKSPNVDNDDTPNPLNTVFVKTVLDSAKLLIAAIEKNNKI